MKSKYILLYNGERWLYHESENGLNNLINDSQELFDAKINELFPKSYELVQEQAANIFREINYNTTIENETTNRIKLLLYNKEIIM